MAVSPLLREAAFWFALGSATAAFVIAVLVALVAAAPGIGGTAAVARAVAKGVDCMLDRAHLVQASPALSGMDLGRRGVESGFR